MTLQTNHQQVELWPFMFHNQIAYTPEDLVKLCEQSPGNGIYYLMRADIEKWLAYIDRSDLADLAQSARQTTGSDEDRLKQFITGSHLVLNKDLLMILKKLPDEQLELVLDQARQRNFKFVIVGRAGVGKSSTINSLMGRTLAPVGKFEAETLTVTRYEPPAHVIPYTVFDTPGLCDVNGNDRHYLELIHAQVKGNEIDCIWFVTPLDETRVRQDEIQAIRNITAAFGPKIWERAVIIFTFADRVAVREYSEYLTQRTRLIRQEIAKQTDGKTASEVPSVAVSNVSPRTPDDKLWLGALFKKVLLKISEEGVGGFWLEIVNWRGVQVEGQDRLLNGPAENINGKKNDPALINNIFINVAPCPSPADSATPQPPPPPPIIVPADEDWAEVVGRVATSLARNVGQFVSNTAKEVVQTVVEPVRRGIQTLSNFVGSFFKKKH